MARWLPGAQRSAPTGARSRSSPPRSRTSPAPARRRCRWRCATSTPSRPSSSACATNLAPDARFPVSRSPAPRATKPSARCSPAGAVNHRSLKNPRPTNRPSRWSAPRSAPTGRRSLGWATTSPSRRSRSRLKRCSRRTPSRCGDASPTAPARRSGASPAGGDPASPACAESHERALPSTPSLSDPCQGPFSASQEGRTAGISAGNIGDDVPRLSADGYEVAFLSNSPLASIGQVFGGEEPQSDLYLVNMHEPLTRTQALRPLTELASADQQDLSENAPIEDFGISPDGLHVAFSTKRTQFPLGSPAYVSAPASIAGMLALFEVDLENDTLTRVTQGFEGGPSEHPHEARAPGEDPYFKSGDGALSPSFSDEGALTAFSSTASNLVFGDGNTPPIGSGRCDGSDAFVVARKIFTPMATPQAISPVPGGPPLAPSWRLGVTARSRADGSVLLYVSVPGAGTVPAAAQSAGRVKTRRRGPLSTSVATRSVASSKKSSQAGTGALLTLTLKLASRYRALAGKRPGLAGSVAVTFTAARHPTLKQTVRVSFLQTT